MVRGYTTIKQSKKLLSLGLDQSTADMVWRNENMDTFIHYTFPFHLEDFEFCDLEKDIPCWSLTALLELIPQDNNLEHDWAGWYMTYENHSTEDYDIPIDAAFEMVCWLIEYEHIKVKK